MYKEQKPQNGFTILEALVTALLLTIVFTAGSMLFVAGERLWSLVDGQIQLQENARQAIGRISAELRESGRDINDILQVWVSNNAGPNNSDILRFAIPLCLCSRSVMDNSMEVRDWGAPMAWGSTSCVENYPVGQNGKVTICHLPPGNPNNKHTLQVAPAAVKAHLAHGDWLGDCNDCDPTSYNNRFVEYRINANGQLLRRVLSPGFNELNSAVVASHITDLQARPTAANEYNIRVSLSGQVYPRRTITLTREETVTLKNY